MFKCKFCDNEYDKQRIKNYHQNRCRKNPDRIVGKVEKIKIEEAKLPKVRKKHGIGINNSMYGKIWIYNESDNKNKVIYKSELENYLNLGWIKGRKIEYDNKTIIRLKREPKNIEERKCLNCTNIMLINLDSKALRHLNRKYCSADCKKEAERNRPPKTKIYKISEETRKKISIGRKKYLDDNPGQLPHNLRLATNSIQRSEYELLLKEKFDKEGITYYEEEYPILRYSLDFAFIDKKIDVEIDGWQHKLKKSIIMDEERDNTLKNLGWTVLRFTTNDIQNNIDEVYSTILKFLSS